MINHPSPSSATPRRVLALVLFCVAFAGAAWMGVWLSREDEPVRPMMNIAPGFDDSRLLQKGQLPPVTQAYFPMAAQQQQPFTPAATGNPPALPPAVTAIIDNVPAPQPAAPVTMTAFVTPAPAGTSAVTAAPAALPAGAAPPRAGFPLPLPSNADLAQLTTGQILQSNSKVNMTDPAVRAELVRQLKAVEDARLNAAHEKARKLGLPITGTKPGGGTFILRDFDGERPVYDCDENVNAAISTATDLVRGITPYGVDGTGVAMGLWEAGGIPRTTHQEFYSARIVIGDGGTTTTSHATHVACTLIGAGYNAAIRGMAPGGSLVAYTSTNDYSEMTAAGAAYAGEPGKINLSNHSYGNLTGWDQDGLGRWIWLGTFTDNGNAADDVDEDFGRYGPETGLVDGVAAVLPYYLPFISAGNHRNDGPTSGQSWYEGSATGTRRTYNTSQHPGGDGTYKAGYDNIEGDKLGKNVLAVGATLDAVTAGARNTALATLITFSSTGPADDGRIKPDIVANGNTLTSASNTSDTATTSSSGTSMSSPNASGSALLLQQYFSNRFPGKAIRADTMKGLIIHTADDIGRPGPDYQYGWGLMNTKAAADVIKDHANNAGGAAVLEGTVTDNGVPATATAVFSFRWDGTRPLRATLCWTDPMGTVRTGHDNRARALVNDLNLTVQRQGGPVQLPYVMPYVGNWTNAMLTANATTGVNTVDNVEQVYLTTAQANAGTYTITVNYAGTLQGGIQNFALIITGQVADPEISVQEPLNTQLIDGSSTLSFGSVPLGGISTTKKVWVQNTGTASLSLSSLTKTGTHQGDFVIDTTGTLATLVPGAITSFNVHFDPTAAGARTAQLQIGNNDTNENPFDITLTGTGQLADGDLSNLAISAGTLNPAFSTAENNYSAGVSNATATITVTPTARQAGATITVNGVAVSSGATSSPIALSPGANLITIACTANGSTKNYLVTVNRTDGPEIVVEKATGAALQDGASTFDLGTNVVGAAGLAQTLTIRNTGTATLTGLAVSKSGSNAADFSVSNPVAALAPNASATFTVSFTPGASGARNAALLIASNDADENPFDIALAGTGASPAAQMTSPLDGATFTSTTVTFNWTIGTGPTSYSLWIGSTDGGYDLYNGVEGANRSRTISGLPDDGRTVYVSLHSLIGGVYETKKYTYRALTAAKAHLTSHANNSTLTGSTVFFTWTPGAAVSNIALWVGSTPGGYDLYAGSEGKGLARTVYVPATGGKVYVTLWSLIRGVYHGNSYVFNRAIGAKAALLTPANGSTLGGATLNLTWNAGIDVSKYVVWAGSSYGGYDVAAIDAGTNTSQAVTVPQDGGPVYITLWSLIQGAYQGNNYWFTTPTTAGNRPARLLSPPANTSTLASTTVNLNWDAGIGATGYALWIGSAPDGYDLYAAHETGLTRSVTLPGDGRRIYVTLHSLIGGAYSSNSYYFTCPSAPAPSAAQLTSPATGATLGSASLPLVWTQGTGVASYALWLGNTPGAYDLHSSLENTATTSRTITVPTDGRPIYLSLYSFINGAWQLNSYWFTTFNNVTGNNKARMTSPANTSTFGAASATFDWDAGSGVTHYVLWIGSSPGGYDLYASTASTVQTRNVTLPNDGRKIHATLWSLIGGAYRGNSYYYTTVNVPRIKATIISPASGSTLPGSSVLFSWGGGSSVTQYALWIGRMPGGYDLYAGLEGSNLTKTVPNLPTDSSPVYVTLWSFIDGAWQGSEHIYTAAAPP